MAVARRRPRPRPVPRNNAPSYDRAMEKHKLFISYPRSGSNWLNCVMELYFDRPRLRAGANSLLPRQKRRRGYMWFHDHDIFSKLKVQHSNIIYLYRDPEQVIYSILKAEHPQITDALVDEQIGLLKNHHKKYLIDGTSKVNVYYSKLKAEAANLDSLDEFEKFAKFMDPELKSLDKDRLKKSLDMVKKESIVKVEPDKRYFNQHMLSEQYEIERKEFVTKYKDKIWTELITDELKGYFESK